MASSEPSTSVAHSLLHADVDTSTGLTSATLLHNATSVALILQYLDLAWMLRAARCNTRWHIAAQTPLAWASSTSNAACSLHLPTALLTGPASARTLDAIRGAVAQALGAPAPAPERELRLRPLQQRITATSREDTTAASLCERLQATLASRALRCIQSVFINYALALPAPSPQLEPLLYLSHLPALANLSIDIAGGITIDAWESCAIALGSRLTSLSLGRQGGARWNHTDFFVRDLVVRSFPRFTALRKLAIRSDAFMQSPEAFRSLLALPALEQLHLPQTLKKDRERIEVIRRMQGSRNHEVGASSSAPAASSVSASRSQLHQLEWNRWTDAFLAQLCRPAGTTVASAVSVKAPDSTQAEATVANAAAPAAGIIDATPAAATASADELLGAPPSLSALLLDGEHISGAGVACIGSLSSLMSLSLIRCSGGADVLSFIPFESLSCLTKLHLTTAADLLTETSILYLAARPLLSLLDVSLMLAHKRFSAALLHAAFAAMPNLLMLRMHVAPIPSWRIFTPLRSSLEKLIVWECTDADYEPEFVEDAGGTLVESLDEEIDDTAANAKSPVSPSSASTASSVSALGELIALEELILFETPLELSALRCLARCPRLTDLHYRGCDNEEAQQHASSSASSSSASAAVDYIAAQVEAVDLGSSPEEAARNNRRLDAVRVRARPDVRALQQVVEESKSSRARVAQGLPPRKLEVHLM